MEDKIMVLVFWCCVVGCIFCACIINNMKDIKKHYDDSTTNTTTNTTTNKIRVQPVTKNTLPERWVSEIPQRIIPEPSEISLSIEKCKIRINEEQIKIHRQETQLIPTDKSYNTSELSFTVLVGNT